MVYRFLGKLKSLKIENNLKDKYFAKFKFDNCQSVVGENYGVLQNEATNSLKYVKDFDFVKINSEIFEFLLNNRNETFVIRIDVLDKNIIEDNSNVKSITSSKSQEIAYINRLSGNENT